MISINDLNVSFGGYDLFSDVNFHVGDKDKIGLVGKNGSGKSTILKILAGINKPSSGRVMIPSTEKIGYLPQEMEHNRDKSVIDEAMMAFSYIDKIKAEIEYISLQLAEREDYESDTYHKLIVSLNDFHDKLSIVETGNPRGDAEKTLSGLGFRSDELNRPTSTFSQGWNMRIELAKILLSSPSTLLLDEPTNHLDIESIQWLEEYLISYQGALILVSHDRRFLDRVTNRTVELMLGKIHDYKVPYTKYLGLRKERMEQQFAAYENQQRMIEKSEEFIERFRYKATKSNQVQSRIKQLDKIERIEVDEEDTSSIIVKFPPAPRSGNVVVKTKNLTKSYGDKIVFSNADIVIERGEKIALVGRNGEGKTTFMKLLCKDIDPTSGNIELGHNVNLGYYAQNQEELLDLNDTVYETLDKIAVGDIRTKLRDILGAFLFRGDDVNKRVSVLSGGEKSRLAMAKLILNPYNLLALDEPTNHMDIRSKDILKQSLSKYNGTLVVVSHDRDFLDGLVTKVLEFKEGRIREHIGTVSDYLDSLKKEQSNIDKPVQSASKPSHIKIGESKQRKEEDKDSRRKKQLIERCESVIEDTEKEIKLVEIELAELPDKNKLAELINKYDVLKEKLSKLMEDWEKLHN
ncbi:ABC-F family ATP-binding cassette domain-containing protein [Bacteroidales bacterium MB20-C3-3]|nr:ABC-F family ATP-binding cassette domain-containing protein [Bacteroidales bacterium]MBP9584831.1 ABC-F family ATP-binding cassette domain-containing protein [Bacteroidales bacterium]MBP9977852.1 ABC-F family ATP-binding cassette domain-containing protein [Bacteroidales bacterium]WRQ33311.1 ABC-F family ATP-binding cassette domain-containing protein [Bacteroidales bacterium MB20-C3-3]